MNYNTKMDKTQISFGTVKEHDIENKKYWKNASNEEKLMTITYLRECFYGPETTTGRLQRLYKFSKRK